MTTSFWKEAAASLPLSVRKRYAAHFEAAERYEHLFELGIETWRIARRALAKCCRVAAHGLRVAARFLESAARNIRPHKKSREGGGA